jgi:hypothetical protein
LRVTRILGTGGASENSLGQAAPCLPQAGTTGKVRWRRCSNAQRSFVKKRQVLSGCGKEAATEICENLWFCQVPVRSRFSVHRFFRKT